MTILVFRPHWPDSEPAVTPPSPTDSEWFDDARLDEIFASWAESNHPSARGPRADATDESAEEETERPSGDDGDEPDLWSDAGAGLDWDVPDLRQAWTGAETETMPDPPEAARPEPEPEPPAEDGPWTRDRDDVIPAARRKRWGRRKG